MRNTLFPEVENVLLLEGSQPVLARPFDKNRIMVNTLG